MTTARFLTKDPARLQALCELWQDDEREVWITIRGQSMTPTILSGSRLRLRCSRDVPEVGQIAAFRRGDILVIHRLIRIAESANGQRLFVFRGDGSRFEDPPVTLDEVVGMITAVRAPSPVARAAGLLRALFRRVRRFAAQ